MASSPASAPDSISSSESEIAAHDEGQGLLSDDPSGGNGSIIPRGGGHGGSHGNHSKLKLLAARAWKCLRNTFIACTRCFRFNENSSAALMAFISNISVMAIVTVNIYSASYFLAWKKKDSICHVFPDSSSGDEINGIIQLVVIGLPFACLPLALCIGGLAEVAKVETRYGECVAVLVMIEIIYIVFLGAVMTLCMSTLLGKYVARAAGLIVCLLLLCWACCCRYPKCWRYAMCCKCLCEDIDEVQEEDDMV